MIQVLGFVFYILFTLVAGRGIIYAVSRGRTVLSFIESSAISFGLGIGFISLAAILSLYYGLSLSPLVISTQVVILSAFMLFVTNNVSHSDSGGRKYGVPDDRAGWLRTFLYAAVSLEVIYAFFRAIIKPIESYDAIAIYAIKAKILFLSKSLPAGFFDVLIKSYPHPDYPLNIPISETIAYLFMGSFNDQLVKLIFPLYFVAILALLYSSVRRFAGSTYAMLFTFILATIPQFSAYASNAYLDLPLSFYYFGSALLLFRFIEDRSCAAPLYLSAMMAGLAGWTKNEGMMYCIVNISVLALLMIRDRALPAKRRLALLMSYIAIIVAILSPWILIKIRHGIRNDEIDLINLLPGNLIKQLHKLVPICYEFQKQFFGPKKWNIFWPIAVVSIAVFHRKAFSGTGLYIAASIALSITGYILFYMVSYVDVNYFLGKTWSRFLIHFLPVVVYYLSYTLKDEIKL